MRPFSEFESLNGDSPPFASSIYHALQVRVEKPYSGGPQFRATYTWSKSIDDASSTDNSVTWLGGTTSLRNPNRPDLERSVKRNTGADFVDDYFANAQDVLMPEDFTVGSVPRTIPSGRTPAINNTSMSLFKQFNIRERMRLEFRVEAFNAFIHPQFCGPNDGNTSVEFDSSGQIDNTSNFAAVCGYLHPRSRSAVGIEV